MYSVSHFECCAQVKDAASLTEVEYDLVISCRDREGYSTSAPIVVEYAGRSLDDVTVTLSNDMVFEDAVDGTVIGELIEVV